MSVKHFSMSAAGAIVECLRRASVEKVFYVFGESYIPILDAFYEVETIDVIFREI